MTYAWAGDRAGVVTGEAVALDLRPARLGSRGAAYLVDLVLEVLGLGLLLAGLGALSDQLALDDAAVAAVVLTAVMLVFVGYPVAAQTLTGGRTAGKAIFGLRVVRADGGPAPFRAMLMRELVALFLERPGFTLGAGAVISSAASERGQRIGDRWAGTVVVHARVAKAASTTAIDGGVAMPPQLAGWAAGLDLSRLPDGLALAARQFVGRAGELDPVARERVGGQLVTAVRAAVSPAPPPGTPGWAYLAAVLAERRRREESRLRGFAGPAPTAPAPTTPGPVTPVPMPPAYEPLPAPAPYEPPAGAGGGFAPPA